MVVEARFREGWYVDALLINQIANAQAGRGVYHGGEIQPVASGFGGAQSFDSSRLINCGHDARFDFTNDFTLSAWIKPTNVTGYKGIISKEVGTTDVEGNYYMMLIANHVRFFIYYGTDLHKGFDTVGAVLAGVWTHVVARRSGSTINVFINNVKDANTDTLVGTLATTTDDVKIGLQEIWPSYYYFVGSIDEIQMYNVALTDVEVTSLYQTGYAGTTVPIAWYDMEHTRLNKMQNFVDESGNSDGTITGCTASAGGVQADGVKAVQAFIRGADGKLKASTWTADLALPPRHLTSPRYNLAYIRASDKTPALSYVSPSTSPVLAHPATTTADYALASIYQPGVGNGGLIVEDLRMNPLLDMTGLRDCFQMIPASTRWVINTAGSSSVLVLQGLTDVSSYAGTSDYAAIESRVSGNAILQWDMSTNPLFYMRWLVKVATPTATTPNAWFGFGIGAAATTEATSHIAFKLTGGSWYLSNNNGGDETNLLLMAENTNDSDWHVFEVFRLLDDDDSGYKSVAYIDGVYKGQNRWNMPTETLKIGAKCLGVGGQAHLMLRNLKLITQEE